MSNKNLSLLLQVKDLSIPKWVMILLKSMTGLRIDILKVRKYLDIICLDSKNPNLLNLTQYSQPMIFVFSSIIIDLCKDYLHKNFLKIILAGILWVNIVLCTLRNIKI